MSSRRVREKLREAKIARDLALEKSRKAKVEAERLGVMTKSELIQYAADNNIEIDKTAKKAEILEALKNEQ